MPDREATPPAIHRIAIPRFCLTWVPDPAPPGCTPISDTRGPALVLNSLPGKLTLRARAQTSSAVAGAWSHDAPPLLNAPLVTWLPGEPGGSWGPACRGSAAGISRGTPAERQSGDPSADSERIVGPARAPWRGPDNR